MLGFLLPLFVYALVLVLHLVIPARWVDGYVRDPSTGRPLRYRLNGLAVFVVTLALFAVAAHRGLVAWDLFWIYRWQSAAGACALGLLLTLALVLPARARGGLVADLFLGRLDNPQWGGGRVDAKMFLYLAGAIMLEINVLSSAAHHVLAHPADPSPGVLLYAVLFTFFVAEYLTFEEVHLYTYDFFAERVGFKLGWGCLVFYPFFYCVGLWSVAARPNPHASRLSSALALVIFFGGWMLSRGANLQKYFFKTAPEQRAFGLIAPVTVAADGKQLLCSGFWRLSRHINYLGEIAMAVGLTLALGWPLAPLPWLYPLYYVALLLPRQHDDDRRCAAKYGALWQEYCRRVPYRIIPWIY
ncbi:MAG: ergosterol biosynthesis protein [bacterium]|nr:ergosterol biosynthesis protein [bacterium]